MTFGFRVTADTCFGCKACTVECAAEHQLKPGVLLRRVRKMNAPQAGGHIFVSMACNHCDNPACVANCPVGAYTKDEETGLVVQDHGLCIGCKTCVEACPFGAPAFCEEDSTTYKCDGCIGRRQRGLDPVCMMVCPSMNITASDDFDALLSSNPDSQSIKDVVETGPNMCVRLNDVIALDAFADIDGAKGIVERGGEDY